MRPCARTSSQTRLPQSWPFDRHGWGRYLRGMSIQTRMNTLLSEGEAASTRRTQHIADAYPGAVEKAVAMVATALEQLDEADDILHEILGDTKLIRAERDEIGKRRVHLMKALDALKEF